MREDIVSKIEELIKPLTKVSKTWHEHLSKHLDEYMSCLAELMADDDLGLAAINFVQAGIMIESTTKVYAVNVDYLWQFTTEVLQAIQSDKKSKSNSEGDAEGESSRTAEEITRKRRRKAVCDGFEEFTPHVINPDLKSDENPPIKPLPHQIQVLGKSDLRRRKRPYHIFDMEGDTIDPSEYSMMYQTSTSGKLQLNMLKDMIDENTSGERNLTEMVHVLQLIVHELTPSMVVDDFDDFSNPPSVGYLSDGPSIEDDIPDSSGPELMPVTPPPSPLTIKRSSSAIESLLPIKRCMSDAGSEKEILAGGCTSTKRADECAVTSNPWTPVPLDSGLKEKALKKKQTNNVPASLKSNSSERKRQRLGDVLVMVEYVDRNMLCIYRRYRRFHLLPEYRRYYIQAYKNDKVLLRKHSTITTRLRLRPDEIHRQLAENITSDFTGFEDTEADPGEEEGFLGFPGEQEFNLSTEAVVGLSDHEEDCMEEDNVAQTEVHTQDDYEQPCCSSQNTEVERLTSIPAESDESCRQMVERVVEWERYIRPRLKLAQERGHFDIHGIGTEILSSFTPESEAVGFKEITRDKQRVDVARYFLAALQLANTYNIEISQSEPGELAMDCMQLRLLSSVRHHEELEDYEAPSEGARKRRKRVLPSEDSTDSDSGSDSDGGSVSDSSSSCRNKRKRNKR